MSSIPHNTENQNEIFYSAAKFFKVFQNSFMKPLTADDWKDVFIIDDSLYDRSRSLSEEEIIHIYGKRISKYSSNRANPV